jgi:hypothetical protein
MEYSIILHTWIRISLNICHIDCIEFSAHEFRVCSLILSLSLFIISPYHSSHQNISVAKRESVLICGKRNKRKGTPFGRCTISCSPLNATYHISLDTTSSESTHHKEHVWKEKRGLNLFLNNKVLLSHQHYLPKEVRTTVSSTTTKKGSTPY